MFRRHAVTLALLALPLLTSEGCASSLSCSEAGCRPSVHFQSAIRVQGPSDTLALTVCRNGTCAHGTAKNGGCSLDAVSTDLLVSCSLTTASGTTTIAFDIPGFNSDQLKDGDIYIFRVQRGATNESLVEVTRSATYTTTQPNGPGCGPTCKSADLS
jgi:hypothetical protein